MPGATTQQLRGSTVLAVGSEPDDAGGEDPGALPRARILLVDDDKRNLLALSEVLDDIADVVCAVSGEEALRFLLKEQFAVIILDVLMPGLDGYDTARLLRGREQSRDTPVIFLSAINKEEAHLLKGYDIGAVDYVFKPFDPTILRSKVSVFVSLYEKTREIERKAQSEQRLLEEKLAALEALKESEERQSLILRSLPIAVYERQGDAVPRFVAGNLHAITGYGPDAFVEDGRLWESRLHPDEQLHAGEAEVSREFKWRHRDGSYRYLLDQSVALPGRDGVYAGTLRDVTEQRHLQDQLLQAQKMDAIGKLTGGIAHDFNNLLASVLSGLSLLERRAELNDKAREIMGMTRHAAEQGKHLVSRMLVFSRKQTLAPRSVDLAEMSGALDGLLTPVLGGLVDLKWEIDDDLWPVQVDPSQLELAIMNLVINARDAMPGGGSITIRLRNSARGEALSDLQPGQYVVVTVSDTGKGIPAQLIPQVIEPFFTTKDVGKGTGLGLSTSYGFAKQSGGTLRIESAVDVGTNVEIWLPRATGAAAVEPIWEAASEHQPAVAEAARILLVDDNASLRGLTEMQLTDEGYDVVCAAGGAEALALIERDARRFDVIVTDFAMPLISGLEVIRLARNVRSNWPAVIITGHSDVAAIADRPTDVPLVTKPFSVEDLVRAISEASSAVA
jgi:signal transduction histidine kinase/two-component SAPR family response regulator